jgi:hypothetical protein
VTTLNVDFVTETCCHEGCNLTFAFTREFYNRVRNDHTWWYCPLGHVQHYNGKTDAQKLDEAKARETALQDQLGAAIRDAEATRAALMRDRQRFANGVCPCCNRSFPNVRAHMATKHPDFSADVRTVPKAYKCSCGRKFDTYAGMRIHQGRQRRVSGPFAWDKPGQSRWWSHLTEVGAR